MGNKKDMIIELFFEQHLKVNKISKNIGTS